jgi:hypothetical protein
MRFEHSSGQGRADGESLKGQGQGFGHHAGQSAVVQDHALENGRIVPFHFFANNTEQIFRQSHLMHDVASYAKKDVKPTAKGAGYFWASGN